eukprot:1369154-Pleurochrysis_carterae.AAC.2
MVMPIMPPTAECVVETGLQWTHTSSKGPQFNDSAHGVRCHRKISSLHFQVRGKEQPARHGADDAQVSVHQNGRVHVPSSVARRISNALANGISHGTASKYGAAKLEDHSQHACLPDGQRL